MDTQQLKTWEDVFEVIDNDFERFPLPIEFCEREELKKLNLRKQKLEELAKRYIRIKTAPTGTKDKT